MEFASIEHRGRRVRYASVGTGIPVVLMHGFPDGPQSWSNIAAGIADAGHRAIVPFLRGYHADTIVSGRAYGRVEFADDVVHLLDALELETAVLVGHDWGAAYVWSTLGTHPDRVLAAVPIAIPHPACLRPSPRLLWGVRHFFYFKAPRSNERAARDDFAYVENLYKRWSPNWSDQSRDAAVAEIKAMFADPSVLNEALQYYRDLPLKPDPASDFRVACPGLLVAGAEDFGGDMEPYENSIERFDAPAELLSVQGAGHWPHRENEPQFLQHLLVLIDSIS